MVAKHINFILRGTSISLEDGASKSMRVEETMDRIRMIPNSIKEYLNLFYSVWYLYIVKKKKKEEKVVRMPIWESKIP